MLSGCYLDVIELASHLDERSDHRAVTIKLLTSAYREIRAVLNSVLYFRTRIAKKFSELFWLQNED